MATSDQSWKVLDKKQMRADQTIFEQGEMGDAVFIVQTGAIELFKVEEGNRISLATLRSGEIFGEMAILDDGPQLSSARAIENSLVVRIPRGMIDARLAKSDKFLRGLLRTLVGNLRILHNVTMKRPRSAKDYLNAIDFHLQGLRSYIDFPSAEDVREESRGRLDAMGILTRELKEVFADHQDSRESALDESDLSSQGKPEKIPRANPEWENI
jgi:CRP-like cAMP-binding protein